VTLTSRTRGSSKGAVWDPSYRAATHRGYDEERAHPPASIESAAPKAARTRSGFGSSIGTGLAASRRRLQGLLRRRCPAPNRDGTTHRVQGSAHDQRGARMNIVGLREAKTKLTALGRKAQKGRPALVTRRGRPFFVVVGVEGDDLVDVLVRWDPDFWKDLDARRKASARRSISLDDFERSDTKGRKKTVRRGSRNVRTRR